MDLYELKSRWNELKFRLQRFDIHQPDDRKLAVIAGGSAICLLLLPLVIWRLLIFVPSTSDVERAEAVGLTTAQQNAQLADAISIWLRDEVRPAMEATGYNLTIAPTPGPNGSLVFVINGVVPASEIESIRSTLGQLSGPAEIYVTVTPEGT
ncbi:MAG: hypothetical protein AAF747_06995 [Planctomycetota bacterium]